MYIESKYKQIIEKDALGLEHCFLVFTDGMGIIQKVEVEKEVGNQIIEIQKEDINGRRKEEYHCVSLEEFDYEGDFFAENDTFFEDLGQEDVKETIMKVLSLMTIDRALLIYKIFIQQYSQKKVAAQEGVTPMAISKRLVVAQKEFKEKYHEELKIEKNIVNKL